MAGLDVIRNFTAAEWSALMSAYDCWLITFTEDNDQGRLDRSTSNTQQALQRAITKAQQLAPEGS